MTPLVFPLLYPSTRPLNYPDRAGIPNYKEGVITPSHGRPETSASPTWSSAAVTGTFHTLLTVYLRPRRTLPDSADLPPGLYSAAMDPSYNIHFLRTIQLFNNSTHAYLPYRNLCQIRTINTLNSDKSRNPLNLRNTHTVQITLIFIDFRICNFAFALKTQNAPCVSRFKRVLFSDRFQFAF